MATLNQTITLNTDLFPLGGAINKSFQKTVTINGNATVFGTKSLDTNSPNTVESIEISPIDDRAIVFLQAGENGVDRINVGLYNETGVSGVATTVTLNTPGPGPYINDTYLDVATTGGAGTGLTLNIVVSGSAITSQTVNTPGFGYATADVVSVVGEDIGGTNQDDATFDLDAVTTAPSFDTIMQIAAGELALVPFKHIPQVTPVGLVKLGVKLNGTPAVGQTRTINFSILETA